MSPTTDALPQARVRLLRAVAALGAAVLWIVLGSGTARRDAAVRILLVWTRPDHAWGTHVYEHECRVLAKCLNQTPGVEAIVSPDPEWPQDEKLLEGLGAIVYYSRYAGDIVLGEAYGEKFRSLMRSGAGYVAIHWATKAEDQKLVPEYVEVLGGAFHTFEGWGLKTTTLPLVQVDPEHAACRGWKPYDLHEEFYLGLRFSDKVRPIVKVNVDGTDQTVAWSIERPGGGRSFGTTLGHFHENFTIEAFRRAIVNGILWSAKVEVPADGAPVALSEDDLKLPPEPGR
jgi:type 1 glutamine amidotransferase